MCGKFRLSSTQALNTVSHVVLCGKSSTLATLSKRLFLRRERE